MKRSLKVFGLITGLLGLLQLSIVVSGQVRGLRTAELIPSSTLRFENDLRYSYAQTLAMLDRLPSESERDYALRMTEVIQGALAHLHNWYDHPPSKFAQLIPWRENPFLHLLGRYSGLPQFERYHFSDYRRTLERGIGLCGDHAIVLSQLLDREGIDNDLLSFGLGHVVVDATFANGARAILDADFGIATLDVESEVLFSNGSLAAEYADAGYSSVEVSALNDIYRSGYRRFENVFTFMRLRYIFERVTYVMTWLLPIVMVIFGVWTVFRVFHDNAKDGTNKSTRSRLSVY